VRSTAAVAVVPEAAVPEAAPADEEAAAPKAELLVAALRRHAVPAPARYQACAMVQHTHHTSKLGRS